MPATQPGFRPKQADRFRKTFRFRCKAHSVTNEDVGNALDAYPALRPALSGRSRSEAGGPKAVANAMMRGRKLTHSMAERLVAGLMLCKQDRRDPESGFKVAGPNVASAELGWFLGLLRDLKALTLTSSPAVPAFIVPGREGALARELAEVMARVPGVGARKRPTMERVLSEHLRARVAAMNCDWREALLDERLLRAAGLALNQTRLVIGNLSQALFREAYVYSHELSLGPELDLISHERPELEVAIPVRATRQKRRN